MAMAAQELARLAGGSAQLEGEVARVASVAQAGADAAVFAEDAASLETAVASGAGVIFCTPALAEAGGCEDARLVRVAEPRFAFALAARALAARRQSTADAGRARHPAAAIDDTAELGPGTRVGAGAVIEAGVRVGADCTIGSRAVLCSGTVLGDRVVVQAGAVLGATGFGYVRNPHSGEYLLFPQQGTLVVEDDVEIGANSTIDRGALEETRIGRGTKIDNLVHIGHNCRIGKNVVIAAQVGISGSCVVEDGAVLAGQVGISDHCRIGPGVILGGQAGVYRGKTVSGPGELFAGTPAEPIREHMKSLARLRRLRGKLAGTT